MCFFYVLKSKHTVEAHRLHLRIGITHRQLGRLAALTGPWVWAPGFSGSCRCSGQLAWLCPPPCWRVYHSSDSPTPAAPPMGSAKSETPVLGWGVLRVKGCTNIILQMYEVLKTSAFLTTETMWPDLLHKLQVAEQHIGIQDYKEGLFMLIFMCKHTHRHKAQLSIKQTMIQIQKVPTVGHYLVIFQ